MRLVTSWRIAVRSASAWSSSILRLWTFCSAAKACSRSFSTSFSSRRACRASCCASFSLLRSWSAMLPLQRAQGVDVREALQAGDDVQPVEPAGLVEQRRALGEDLALDVQVLLRAGEAGARGLQPLGDLVQLRLRSGEVVSGLLQVGLQVRHLGARALGLLLQVEERGGGRRRRSGHGGRQRARRHDDHQDGAQRGRPAPSGRVLAAAGSWLVCSRWPMSLPCALTAWGIGLRSGVLNPSPTRVAAAASARHRAASPSRLRRVLSWLSGQSKNGLSSYSLRSRWFLRSEGAQRQHRSAVGRGAPTEQESADKADRSQEDTHEDPVRWGPEAGGAERRDALVRCRRHNVCSPSSLPPPRSPRRSRRPDPCREARSTRPPSPSTRSRSSSRRPCRGATSVSDASTAARSTTTRSPSSSSSSSSCRRRGRRRTASTRPPCGATRPWSTRGRSPKAARSTTRRSPSRPAWTGRCA